jgi:hypothetical protein
MKITVIFLVVCIRAIVFAFPIMLLWNWLIPEIFKLNEIGFWQAFGLSLLSSLLFKNKIKIKG